MYNAGNGGEYTLNYIWKLLQDVEGVQIPAKYGPPRLGDVKHSMADTMAAARDLGHAPCFTLEEGLKRTLNGTAKRVKGQVGWTNDAANAASARAREKARAVRLHRELLP